MKLHGYFRSSAAYRVRIAMNLKGLTPATASVHLTRDGGAQKSTAYRTLNPQGLVPALEIDGAVLTQSMAILEYLEETHPVPSLLPNSAIERAKVRAFAQAIACDIHPLNNLRVLNYLKTPLSHDQPTVDTWYRHWTEDGLIALEALLPKTASKFCFSETPTLADICLVPQMFNARRFKSDLSKVPRLVAIDAHCQSLPTFAKAAPGVQPDAE